MKIKKSYGLNLTRLFFIEAKKGKRTSTEYFTVNKTNKKEIVFKEVFKYKK